MYAVNAKQEINLIWPNQNLLVRALKSKFSQSSVYFSNWYFSSTSNNQRNSSFHQSNCTCFCDFCHMCFVQRWLIGEFLHVNKFDWFAWIHIPLSEILLTVRVKRSSNNCKQCLFIVSKIGIIWSSPTTPEFINYQLWTSYKILLSLKYLFHFFLSSGWLHFFYKSTEE